MRIFESNQKQNLVVFMNPSGKKSDISLKGGNMILNRFCIDEDVAFELSGVTYLKKSSHNHLYTIFKDITKLGLKMREKGMKYSF